MSRIVGKAVAFVVKTGRCFRRTGGRRGEDKTENKTQDSQRDQESHGSFPLFQDGLATGACIEDLYPRGQDRQSTSAKVRPCPTREDEGSFMNTTFAGVCTKGKM